MMHDGNDKMNSMETEMMANAESEKDLAACRGVLSSQEALTWCLNRDGLLEISGLGKIPDFSCGRNPAPPWEEKKDLIRELVIREGVDEIGIRAFAGCRNLEKADLPETLCRIDAYAFMDCTRLEKVLIPEGVRLCHIYEQIDDSADAELLRFGINAFYRTPWALTRWGKYYIRSGVLYALFTDEENAELPSNVHTISKFAFAGTNARTVRIPDSVTAIGDYAFTSSRLRFLAVPDSVSADKIGSFAFTGTELSSVSFPGRWGKVRRALIDQLLNRETARDPDEQIRLPSFFEIGLAADRKYGPFKKITIRERKPKTAGRPDTGTSKCIYGVRALYPGVPLQRKIQRGSVLIGIIYDDIRIQHVVTCSWNRDEKCPENFRLYPCIDPENGTISAWSDCRYGVDDNSINWYYACVTGTSEDGAAVRAAFKDCHEEWFWSNGEGFYSNRYYGGNLEIDLLELWIRQHPEVRILSSKEWGENNRSGEVFYMPPGPEAG